MMMTVRRRSDIDDTRTRLRAHARTSPQTVVKRRSFVTCHRPARSSK
jgi:hypothetical protein